jgi:hypothetical protein
MFVKNHVKPFFFGRKARCGRKSHTHLAEGCPECVGIDVCSRSDFISHESWSYTRSLVKKYSQTKEGFCANKHRIKEIPASFSSIFSPPISTRAESMRTNRACKTVLSEGNNHRGHAMSIDRGASDPLKDW